ncbi:hypothetical protein HPP92_011703 [Vanilla planifolia]|nr:hypothetical protein HPP92_011703 [Vanilla planifolia]
MDLFGCSGIILFPPRDNSRIRKRFGDRGRSPLGTRRGEREEEKRGILSAGKASVDAMWVASRLPGAAAHRRVGDELRPSRLQHAPACRDDCACMALRHSARSQ